MTLLPIPKGQGCHIIRGALKRTYGKLAPNNNNGMKTKIKFDKKICPIL